MDKETEHTVEIGGNMNVNIQSEPLWLARVHQEQRLMKRLEEKQKLFKMIVKAQSKKH